MAGTNWLVLIAASSKLTAELTGYADHKSESASPKCKKNTLEKNVTLDVKKNLIFRKTLNFDWNLMQK